MSRYTPHGNAGHRPQGRKYKQALEMARNRLVIAGILFVFILFGVGGRLIFMGLSNEGGEPLFVHDAVRSQFHQGRSDIVDRNGVVLATTVTTSSLYANAKKVLDAEIAAKMLAQALPGYSKAKLLKKLKSNRRFIWLARHLTPKQRDRIMHLGIPGVRFRKDFKRLYPHGPLVSHVVGLTNIDNVGIAGLEKSNEQFLLTEGKQLDLSLDVRVQHAIADELKKGMQEFNATGAAAIVMDLQTSEVLGMVSLPDYNPNKNVKLDSDGYFNRATVGMYEMGSTFKILNTAMALESGTITLATKYDTSEDIKIGRFSISDYRANHGVINVAQVFVHSSNKGSVKMALDVGTEGQQDFMQKVGCLTRCNIEVPEKGQPIIPRHWREANTMTISYGYGLAVSPLHLLNSVASVVGDGCRKEATLIKLKEGEKRRPCDRVVQSSVAHKMRQLLRLVVVQGTSKKANVPGYFVAAKTGTRNMLESSGAYNKNRVSTTFVGLIGESVENPRYIVVALLEDPKGLKKTFGFTAAGWNVAPIGGRILGRVAPILGLQPNLKILNEGFDPFLQSIDFSKKKK
ncbi:MAG TPA: penicillin-binding protein [Holosporales bacterium]|nr:penicillin-binding protein [Holosporales bacterium]